MSLAPLKVWTLGEQLAAADLVAEFGNIYSNPISLISPLTGDVDAASHVITDAILKNNIVTFADGDTTPSVTSGTVFKTANTGATNITMFDGGLTGQTFFLLINDTNTTVDFTGTNLIGNSGADWSPTVGDWLRATFVSPYWYCSTSTVESITSGTWTPSLGGNTTYTSRTGVWTRIGPLVYIAGKIAVNVIGTGSQVQFTGVPFTPSGVISEYPILVTSSNTLAVSVVSLSAALNLGGIINLYSRLAANVSEFNNNVLGDGSLITFAGIYRT